MGRRVVGRGLVGGGVVDMRKIRVVRLSALWSGWSYLPQHCLGGHVSQREGGVALCRTGSCYLAERGTKTTRE